MTEEEFQDILTARLKEYFKKDGIVVNKWKNLIYRVIVGSNMKYVPETPLKNIRGRFAFQTDILISKDSVPLVVIELKYRGITTHNILTYSSKAQEHKRIYPYLRYGLVVGGRKNIPKRFFVHNFGFDFAFALPDLEDRKETEKLVEILREQVLNASTLLKIFEQNKKVKFVNSSLKIE